jgi:hypothetical protein
MGRDIWPRYCKPFAALKLLLRSFGGWFLNRYRSGRRFLRGVALVSIELLLHSRLTELTRVCRELHVTGLTGPERWDAADPLEDTKSALCHVSVSHSSPNCATLAGTGNSSETEYFPCFIVIATISAPAPIVHQAAKSSAAPFGAGRRMPRAMGKSLTNRFLLREWSCLSLPQLRRREALPPRSGLRPWRSSPAQRKR